MADLNSAVPWGSQGLASLALRQLAAWQQVAAGWPLRRGHDHLRCAACAGPVLALADPGGSPYLFTPQQITDGTVMHLRARHPDAEPAGL